MSMSLVSNVCVYFPVEIKIGFEHSAIFTLKSVLPAAFHQIYQAARGRCEH